MDSTALNARNTSNQARLPNTKLSTKRLKGGKMLINKSKIKEIVQQYSSLSVATDVAEKLNEKAEQLLKDAARRAKQNNRHTVMGRDI